jgi:L-alanine-DL-glutamate epimerase-like enolase superfamily enzyme
MRITGLEINCCRLDNSLLEAGTLNGHAASRPMEFLVLSLNTDTGIEVSSFGFAGASAVGSGHQARAAFDSLLIGQNPLDREKIWQQFRVADRWWNHLPFYSYGPIDICLWLIGAKSAGQPLYKYIGAHADEVQTYCSSLVLPTIEAYCEEALSVKQQGFKAYKIHPPGSDIEEDIEIHRAVRDVVGGDFALMSDPVAPYSFEEALRLGRELEKLDYLWLEEPLADENASALRKLTAALDIPIVGAEVLAKHPYSIADYLSSNVIDAIRADVSWSGGVTGVLKSAHLAESFGARCELHSTIFHPLELVNLHLCAAISNNSYFELLTPTIKFNFGLKESIEIEQGMAKLPKKSGLGIEFDWSFIDSCTIAKV